jgi:hypothetical protein
VKTLVLRLDVDGALTHPMHAFVAERPEYGPTRLLQWNPHGLEANVLLFYVDGPREPYLSALEDVETARAYEPSDAAGVDGFYLFTRERLTGGDRELFAAFTDEDLVVLPPIVYDVDGCIRLTVVGDADALQRTVDRSPDGADVSVVRIRSGVVGGGAPESALSDRQREVLAGAVAAGYYEVPRESTLEDVGERLDAAPSTVAEHLRKAEAALVGRAVAAPGSEGPHPGD